MTGDYAAQQIAEDLVCLQTKCNANFRDDAREYKVGGKTICPGLCESTA